MGLRYIVVFEMRGKLLGVTPTPAVPCGTPGRSRSPFGPPIFASLLVCEQQQQGTFCDSGSPRFPCIIAIILKLYVEQEVLTRAA
jgi:hypothetical protein